MDENQHLTSEVGGQVQSRHLETVLQELECPNVSPLHLQWFQERTLWKAFSPWMGTKLYMSCCSSHARGALYPGLRSGQSQRTSAPHQRYGFIRLS